MKTWCMIIDLARCHDCNDCFLADKDEFVGNEFPPYSAAQPWRGQRWMDIKRRERGQYPVVETAYLPMPCMHCEQAPCLTDDGAVYQRSDGLVIIDPVKAVGRKEIVASCPYDAIYWNEERQLAQKCTGCAHLLDGGWTETRCSHVCPTEAIKLVLGEEEEMAALVAEEGLERYRETLGTKPRVYYKNLHRWTKAFVAGAVVDKASDECAEGVTVVASRDGQKAGEVTTDNYGGFLVDKLEPGVEYTLTVEGTGYRSQTVAVELKESLTLEPVFLERAE
jgi:Fe-S-cluster-containing dehydrogenase component